MSQVASSPDPSSPNQDDAVIGRAFGWSVIVIVLVALGVGAWLWLDSHEPAPEPVAPVAEVVPELTAVTADAEPPVISFTDVTAESGVDFTHVNGAYGERLLPETMGGGVALFDYDNDGDQDLLLVNSDRWPDQQGANSARPTHALYANDGSGRFTDVTAAAGLDRSFYGMGPAVGDFDGDGWVDLFVTAVGRNYLLRNVEGRFEDVTESAGVAGGDDDWSSAAAFLDYDRDGDLDLFVVNYVQWSKAIDLEVDFQLTGIGRAYGPPASYQGTDSKLYRNDGDGGFTEVSAQAGIEVANPDTGFPMGKGLAVAPVDVDGDGWLDLIVANDTVQNFLFRNRGDGTFEEVGVFSGLAFDRNGHATGAMGVDAAWFRNDADLGVGIGNFANEMTALYVAPEGDAQFSDEAVVAGIGPASRLRLTFGVVFLDYDLDGRQDLLQANGHVENAINKVQSSQSHAQSAQLFWNCGDDCAATYVPVAETSTGDLAKPMVGRAVAYADLDADGDLDIVLTQVAGPPLLLRNEQQTGHNWLRLRLKQPGANPNALGALVTVEAGGQTQRRRVMPTRGYLTQVELPLTFGLGDAEQVDRVVVRWPDGTEQQVGALAVNEFHQVERVEAE